MALVTSTKFFQERSSLIQGLELKKNPGKITCKRFVERICRIWRSICELFSPKIYQKKLNKQLDEIKTRLVNDHYRQKVESFYKKFVEEAKGEACSLLLSQTNGSSEELEKLFQMPLDTRESIREFSYKLQHQFYQPLQGKLFLLSDCFEWKEKMGQLRDEVIQKVANVKVKKSSSYDLVFQMIKKVKKIILAEAKDIKSYSHFMREFTEAISELTFQKATEAICKLDQEKNKHSEKYQSKINAIQERLEKNPSIVRLCDLNLKLRCAKRQLKATKLAFFDLYEEWLKGMQEIKSSMSKKILSNDLRLLAFWKKKLEEQVKSKEHLDLFIEILVRLDRICLTLKSKDNLDGKKLVTSGLSVSLNEAMVAFNADAAKIRELSDSPKHLNDQISKLLDHLITKRLNFLTAKTHQFLSKDEDRLLLELQQCGLKRCHLQNGENYFFDACVKGFQYTIGIAPEFKAMDAPAFRKVLYEYMKNNRKDYLIPLVKELKEDLFPMYLISEDLLQKNLSGDELEAWLLTDGAHKYMENMGEKLDILPGNVEIQAASKLLNVPIHVHQNAINSLLKDRTDGMHLLRINGSPPYFDLLIPQKM